MTDATLVFILFSLVIDKTSICRWCIREIETNDLIFYRKVQLGYLKDNYYFKSQFLLSAREMARFSASATTFSFYLQII